MAGLYAPLPTLRRRPRGRLRTDRGRRGLLLLHRSGLSPHTPCQSPGALTVVPAYNLPVYASQRPLPDATQDSVRGCLLGFAAAVIADGRLQRACKAQPAQIPASAANAPGSSLGCMTAKRLSGYG